MTDVQTRLEAGAPVPLRVLVVRPAIAAVALVGIALRIWIMLSPQGVLNADEAYTGLQAAEIARGHHVVVIGGAAYTGTIDTYLLAPIVGIFGQHVLTLKVMSPILWAIAALLVIGAARRIVPDRWALLAGASIWLAPGALAILSTRGYVAYALGFALVVGMFWSALVIVEQPVPVARSAAVFGALAGLAFYTHPMFVAVVGPVAAVVALRHRWSGRTFWLPAGAAALLVNLPFLLWNAKNSWPSLDQPPQGVASTYGGRLRGFFVGLLPRDLGVRRMDGAWTFGRPLGAAVVLAVLGLAIAGAVLQMRVDRWRGALLMAPLVLAWPLMAGLENLAFVDDGRYGIIVFPVLVLCMVAGVAALSTRMPRVPWTAFAAAWLLVCAVPFLHKEAGTDLGDPNVQARALVQAIEDAGFDRVAGNYFAVLPIEVESGGRIRTAIAGNPYTVRLPHSQQLVDATPPSDLAYVFAPGPIGPTWVKLPVEQYRQVPVAGWVIYFPT